MNLVRDPRWVRTPRRDTATSLTLQRLLRCLVGADLWREGATLTELLSLRQGRAQEVPGECPYLTGEVGSILIKATQESAAEPRYLRVASTMKHSPMYDMEGYNDGGCATHDGSCGTVPAPAAGADYRCDTFRAGGCNRRNFDSSPPMRDFASYYTAAFKTISQVIPLPFPPSRRREQGDSIRELHPSFDTADAL